MVVQGIAGALALTPLPLCELGDEREVRSCSAYEVCGVPGTGSVSTSIHEGRRIPGRAVLYASTC